MPASRLPTENSSQTVVDSTSVRMRVAPEKIRIGPNSPSARAQDNVAAVSKPRRASGKGDAPGRTLAARVQPSRHGHLLGAGASDIWSKVTRMVRTANAPDTENCARITLGTWNVTPKKCRWKNWPGQV